MKKKEKITNDSSATLWRPDPRMTMSHKKKCRKCRFASTESEKTLVTCDYMLRIWDETGSPKRRPCEPEHCTAYEPREKSDKLKKPAEWK